MLFLRTTLPSAIGVLARWSSLFALWLTLSLMAGCALLPGTRSMPADNLGANQETGQVVIKASLANIRAAELTNSVVTLTLRKDERDRTQVLQVVDSTITANIANLLPGQWEVILTITDNSGVITYQAKEKVSILSGGTASLNLILRPAVGVLEVSVDPLAHSELISAKRGRLYVNPGGYSSMTTDALGILIGSKELAPGTYDFSITLYSDSYYASDRLYESPWSQITISPGRTTRIQWNPVTGTCIIDGKVDSMPAAPTVVQLAKVSQGLYVNWQPVADTEGDLVGYRIYLREDPFGKFELIHEGESDKNFFVYPSSELHWGTHLEVAVTAVDAGGQESERSILASLDY